MIDIQLPLTDLHRHLDGNIRPETILDLARQHNIPLQLMSWKHYVRMSKSLKMSLTLSASCKNWTGV